MSVLFLVGYVRVAEVVIVINHLPSFSKLETGNGCRTSTFKCEKKFSMQHYPNSYRGWVAKIDHIGDQFLVRSDGEKFSLEHIGIVVKGSGSSCFAQDFSLASHRTNIQFVH